MGSNDGRRRQGQGHGIEPRRAPAVRRWLPAGTALVGLAVVVVGSFGPWLVSGRRQRSSYELLQVADRLGFLGDGLGRLLPRTWVFVPLAAALVVGALTANRHRLAGTIATVVGVYSLVLSAGVSIAPVPSGWGTDVVGVGGTLAVVGGIALVTSRPGPQLRPDPVEPHS